MEDIAPVLYKQIEKDFNTAVKSDGTIKTLATKLEKRPLSDKELRTIATRLGKHASDALQKTLTVDNLPDGKMYWNIAERTIKPIMDKIYDAENNLQILSLRIKDKMAGVNISIAKGVNPIDRITEIMDFACNSNTADELYNALNLPVQTTALDFNDDFMEANAELRDGMGFNQTITREYDGVGLGNGRRPCNWCIGRAGTYNSYREAKDAGAFERHTGCGCMISWDTADTVDNDDVGVMLDLPF